MLKGKELGAAINRAIDLKIARGAVASKADIARHFGIKPPSIHDWIKKGSIGKEKLPELWRYFSDVVGPEHWGLREFVASTNTTYDVNVEPAPKINGTVPLISWVQAGAFCQAPDLFQPGDAEDWVPCIQKLGPHAYALRVVGDSMTAPYGRSYPEGCIIFVDPDYPVTNGCRVIAKVPATDEATFKCYVEDAGKKYLMPLNTRYEKIEITTEMILCGVVRGSFMPE